MPAAPFRDPFLAALAPRLAALAGRTRAAVAGLSAADLARTPPAGGWSVAQVFEHLCRGNEAYFVPMAAAIASARRRGRPPRPHRSSIAGGLLLAAIAETNPRRLPTTPKMTPLAVRDGVVEAFAATLARIESLAREADGADLRERMWSPLGPLPLNLGDAFAILVTHAERHLAQAERARRAIGA
jgi:hypothetical protein